MTTHTATTQTAAVQSAATPSRMHEYCALAKPRVVALIVFTAVVGMFLAVPGLPPLDALIYGTLGIGLAASSAAAINHVLDARADRVMARTRARPLPTGTLSGRQAMAFALVLGAAAMTVLAVKVNALTAILTFLSLIGYAVIYTAWLKHATPQNIVIGGAAGAAPPVLGWAAATGMVSPDALLLFLIIFIWTPPHFWALALYRRDEYARAGIPMLPVISPLSRPSWPRKTASTASLVDRQRKTASTWPTRSAGEAATAAPKASALARVRFQTVSVAPASRSRVAIAVPRDPSPMKPTSMVAP